LTLAAPSAQIAEDMAKMAEAAWYAEASYFGTEPPLDSGTVLSVELSATVDAWTAAMQADGVAPPASGGGYYAPGNRKVYLYRQPTEYFTRCLFLHEITHQFHWLSRTNNTSQGPFWYGEGIAEYLSRHDWDGRCLRLGVLPMISQEDYQAAALGEVSAAAFNLTSALSSPSRQLSMAFYRFLERGKNGTYRSGFAEFRATVDHGGADWSAVLSTDVGAPAALQPEFVNWLQQEQQPMTPIFVDWVHVKPGSVRSYGIGSAQFSAARIKQSVSHLEVSVPVPYSGWAGVLVAFRDNSNWVGYLAAPEMLSVARSVDGVIQWLSLATPLPTPPTGGSYEWTVDYRDGAARVDVNGVEATETTTLPLAGGVMVNEGNLQFENLRWN
jgi:hypothetical protein